MSDRPPQPELTATEIDEIIICLKGMSGIMRSQKFPRDSDEYHMCCITINSYRQIVAKLKAMKEAE